MTTFSSNKRHPSTGWSRLKPPPSDPLLTMGLPSKGDNRLLDFKAQESYYNKIVERYMQFCAAAGRTSDALDRAFASLSIEKDSPPSTSQTQVLITEPAPISKTSTAGPSQEPHPKSIPSTQELSTLLLSMRKLREGISSARRTDNFAQRAYIFITRAALLTSSYEAYIPSLQYLLSKIHPVTPLPTPELHEFISYQILDYACRLGDYGAAYAARNKWGYRDERVEGVLRALVHDDWVSFWRVRGRVDGYKRAIMGWAEDGVRGHALKCLGRTYLVLERGFVERCAGRGWEELVKLDGVGWEKVGERITVRRVRAK